MYEIKQHLKRGKVYRRVDLVKLSKSVDRQLKELVKEGTLHKLFTGVYYYPKKSVFGNVPLDEKNLVSAFLKDDRFLLISPNLYNSLGVGTTQLYNKKVVYNHKRNGKFKLGNRDFEFKLKRQFPTKVTEEFLLVDLVNNIDSLAEDKGKLFNKAFSKAFQMPTRKLKRAVLKYGSVKTRKIFHSLITESDSKHTALLIKIGRTSAAKAIKESKALGLTITFMENGVLYKEHANGEKEIIKIIPQEKHPEFKKGMIFYLK
jgi:hypothetical protein